MRNSLRAVAVYQAIRQFIRFPLRRVVGAADRRNLVPCDGLASLLGDVCQFVHQCPSSFSDCRRELTRAKDNVFAQRVRARIQSLRHTIRARAGMNANLAEVEPKPLLHRLADGFLERRAARRDQVAQRGQPLGTGSSREGSLRRECRRPGNTRRAVRRSTSLTGEGDHINPLTTAALAQ